MFKSLQTPFSRQRLVFLFLISLIPFLLSAFFNRGFLATDEYWTGIVRYIPAQNSSLNHLVFEDDVKSPVQILPMHLAAQAALKLGFEHPYHQYIFVVALLGILNSILLLSAAYAYYTRRKSILSNSNLPIIGTLTLAFYFASPVAFTRPMFEAMSAPWLLWAAVFANRYWLSDKSDAYLKNSFSDLALGTLAGAMAFMLRPQTGICCLVFVLLPILKKNLKDFLKISALGGALLILSGLPDLWLRGSWNHSLRQLIVYNFQHGSDYGHQPWWHYFPLLIVLTYMPFWIFKFSSQKSDSPNKSWKSFFNSHLSSILLITLFVGEHMLFAQKFERFLIPIIPVLIIPFAELLTYLLVHFHEYRLRVISLLAINSLLWLATIFSIPQGNLIHIAEYLDHHPEIHLLVRYKNSLEWFPDVFIKAPQIQFLDKNTEEDVASVACPKWVVSLKSDEEQFLAKNQNLKVMQDFESGFMDAWAYKLNPKKNARRAPITLYECKN